MVPDAAADTDVMLTALWIALDADEVMLAARDDTSLSSDDATDSRLDDRKAEALERAPDEVAVAAVERIDSARDEAVSRTEEADDSRARESAVDWADAAMAAQRGLDELAHPRLRRPEAERGPWTHRPRSWRRRKPARGGSVPCSGRRRSARPRKSAGDSPKSRESVDARSCP